MSPTTPATLDRAPFGGLEHPAVIAGVAVAGLVLSYLVALADPVPAWELRLTEWINDLPDLVAIALYPIMQLGTLLGPVLVALGIWWFRPDRLLAAATLMAGLVAWFGAKGIKKMVDRERPGAFLSDINIREGDGEGLGYISGHSAVAATAAIMAMAALPRRWRPVAALPAALVGLARIVHGVHLPADLIGGWSFGALVGVAALTAVDMIDRHRTDRVSP